MDKDDRREVYISDLRAAVNEKESLSHYSSKNRWECVPFETAEATGSFIIASSESAPPPVTLDPHLSGWYKIYVCLGEFGGWPNRVDIKLSGDEFETTVSPCRMAPYTMWTTAENVEESFWKCADMTGQTVTVSKPDTGIKHTSNVFWLRFVPMSESEIKAATAKPKRRMFAHMDGDFHLYDVTKTPRDYCKPIYAMKQSDVGIICEEVINDICDYTHPGDDFVYRSAVDSAREKASRALVKDREKIYPEQIKYAHACGIEVFAGHRMQLSDFSFPFETPLFHVPFVTENGDKCCEARDGTSVGFLSYGYADVRDFMIKTVLESARFGFDGVLCIWTRGVHLMFEEPVARAFAEKFGEGVDIRTLRDDDERLAEIKSDIMTAFHRDLRRALSEFSKRHGTKEMKVFVTGCFDARSSKKDGIDIERLAREGLIDGVIQTKMKMCELTDGVTDESGAVNVEKYAEKALKERMYERISGSRMDLIVEGVGEYARIAKKYGIAFYSENQWETYKKPEEYVESAKEIYSAGGTGISLWDCYPHRVNILSEWAAESHFGDGEYVAEMSGDPNDYHRIIKVLSYNGRDVRFINPSWRG